ncbi:ABC transporter A family member 8 isoform X1 [Dendrobium catenatum]|uniref:ABC transporter A family member 8 n=1 Tax=Dendrobium catenatum TaxID=906689 RepID=A0A2I0WLQ0_9ASPA|nr:ABC transporter A family member 8 isoform X1 [Dendrobium catenatum]XP_028551905.1 ABC transporter A family member 8 isoform X1 [Dendrobium catenatum]XP_028551906.1 ABC transporter A family member 8 isoform X1 [Dendrobium catenatum]PKU76587.1 ABC transporter A family member 8 [Dendrobium catenatum]
MDTDVSLKPVSFWAQLNALMRKNLTFQRRNIRTNLGLIIIPLLLCLLLFSIQKLAAIIAVEPEIHCDCGECIDDESQESCDKKCSNVFDMIVGKSTYCPEPHPPQLPVLFQIPMTQFRATKRSSSPASSNYNSGLPDNSCRKNGSCPVTILITGQNRTFAKNIGKNLFGSKTLENPSDSVNPLVVASEFMLGTTAFPPSTFYFEPAFMMLSPPLYIIHPKCSSNISFPVSIKMGGLSLSQDVKCVDGLSLWRENSSVINKELSMGYQMGNPNRRIDEILAAYDFSNTNSNIFNVTIWHNETYKNTGPLLRISRASNAAANAYLQFFKGDNVKMLLEFVKEMPKGATKPGIINVSTLLSPLFFTWVIELLFPVMLTYLVHEKQNNMRMMMKMHGLGDLPYWIISYAYFLLLSASYMLCFSLFGSLIGIKIFTLNKYSLQFVFYFVCINLQISLAISSSALFSRVKTATVVGYLYVFISGLLGSSIFERFVEDASYPRELLEVMEIFPGFSLYRGFYELAQYSLRVESLGAPHVGWKDINNDKQGMRAVLIIMIVEWATLVLLAYYLDQVVSNGKGVRKHPLWFLSKFQGKTNRNKQRQGYDILINMDKPDVAQEREIVEKLIQEPSKIQAVLCDNLRKVYPGSDGNPDKHAVRGLSLAISQRECFGMLGPNGAGKTSFINMMTGLSRPTSGTALVQGIDISKDMDKVHYLMGVCPQHDLTWDSLTGREHLLFYGRLKNLKGDLLMQAVDESLHSVNLLDKGVADKLVGQYSGGMKRRLSVAISLIGNPRVVYMDEPSTGLDPASRKKLWSVVQQAKKDRAVILTTHSMEEAEALCDRVGIFVDGYLQCIGSPLELKARYGGYFVLTVTTPSNEEEEVEKLVQQISSTAIRVYHLSGTQKFHLPKQGVRLSDIFREVEAAKRRLNIQAWGLSDATLEDVFIKVAKAANSLHDHNLDKKSD